jgi:hypothetical protein
MQALDFAVDGFSRTASILSCVYNGKASELSQNKCNRLYYGNNRMPVPILREKSAFGLRVTPKPKHRQSDGLDIVI